MQLHASSEYKGALSAPSIADSTAARLSPRTIDSKTQEVRNRDPIGRLASVFQGMAREIHAREVKQLRRIQTLQCSVLLLICGGSAGLRPSLSRMSAGMGANPIGLAFWVALIAAALCLVVILFRGGFPSCLVVTSAFSSPGLLLLALFSTFRYLPWQAIWKPRSSLWLWHWRDCLSFASRHLCVWKEPRRAGCLDCWSGFAALGSACTKG